MTTTQAALYNPTLETTIQLAYFNIDAIGEDEVPSAGQYAKGFALANMLMKEWMASGIHVWTEEEAILFLQVNQVRYLLGGASTDNTADANSWTLATLASSAATAATSLVMEDASGIVDGQNIGIVLDSNTTQWTTVNGDPSGNTVTITTGLTGPASAGNYAFVYTTRIIRPLKVPRCRALLYNGMLETPMNVLSRKGYMDLPNKVSPGSPNQFFYSPKLLQGEFYIWNAPQDCSKGVRFTWYRPIYDFDTQANTADLPQEWANALMWNMSKALGVGLTIPPETWNRIVQMADDSLELVRGWDRESEPILFQMGFDETGS